MKRLKLSANHGKRVLSAKEVLAALDEWAIQTDDLESKRLWDVLTALRGPDNEDTQMKLNATVPIRKRALPKWLARIYPWQMTVERETNLTNLFPWHFCCHAENAHSALNVMGL
jgi:hypothetical protein